MIKSKGFDYQVIEICSDYTERVVREFTFEKYGDHQEKLAKQYASKMDEECGHLGCEYTIRVA